MGGACGVSPLDANELFKLFGCQRNADNSPATSSVEMKKSSSSSAEGRKKKKNVGKGVTSVLVIVLVMVR